MTFSARYESAGLPGEIAPGVLLGLPGTATFEGEDLGGAPYTVSLVLDMRDGRVRPVSVTVTAPEGSPPVTSTVIRAVRVRDLFREAVGAALRAQTETADDGGTRTDVFPPPGKRDIELMVARGPVRESLEYTAFIYRRARVAGLDPAREVQLELGLPRTTATRWIRRAKETGLVPEEEGTHGEHRETP